jgi:hypothetical protein
LKQKIDLNIGFGSTTSALKKYSSFEEQPKPHLESKESFEIEIKKGN